MFAIVSTWCRYLRLCLKGVLHVYIRGFLLYIIATGKLEWKWTFCWLNKCLCTRYHRDKNLMFWLCERGQIHDKLTQRKITNCLYCFYQLRNFMRAGCSASILDYISAGSSISVRAAVRLGSAMSWMDFIGIGSACSIRTFARLGSSLSVKENVWLGSKLSVFKEVMYGLFSRKLRIWFFIQFED